MRLDDVIAALVARFTSAVSPTLVFDGPNDQAASSPAFVLVGSTGEDEDGATLDADWSPVGPGRWREEAGEVVCSAWAYSGGRDLPARRAIALGLATSCAESVHQDRSLGGILTGNGAQVSRFRYQPRQTTEGAVVRVVFTVSYRTLLT